MNVLVVDVSGTHVKILVTGETEPRKLDSGPTLTPYEMVAAVKKLAEGWNYEPTVEYHLRRAPNTGNSG